MMRSVCVVCLCAVLGLMDTVTAQEQQPFVPVTDEMLLNPDPADWLMIHRTYAVEGRQYLAVPVGGGTLANLRTYTPELEAPSRSNMSVTFVLP